MTATLTACKATQIEASEEWKKLFPPDVTEYSSSLIFMKQLTAVAVSMITYSRGLLAKESYQTETLGGIELKILKVKCQDEMSTFVSNALKQCFEALDKKYLDKLVLCVYDDNEDLVEVYSFEYSYSRSGGTMAMRSTSRGESGSLSVATGISTTADDVITNRAAYAIKNIREHVINLLKNCSTISPLMGDYDISLRLYYNERAPRGYQAPGFTPEPWTAGCQDPVLAALADPGTIDLGTVGTPSHCLVVRSLMRTPISSLEANLSSAPELPVFTEEDYEVFRTLTHPLDEVEGAKPNNRRVRFQL